ncbi:glycosyltransferase [Microcystis elabens FACHB-917]|nr:glycosyltransferase [Microcystis elabens FACHB-917]
MTSTAIAIFAFRRPAHLFKVLNSLVSQSVHRAFPVYLFLDGPRGAADLSAVDSCRTVAADFGDRLPLVIVESEVNRGLYGSLTDGITAVLADHDQVIVLEDDIVVSPYFLDFMLDGLGCYADNPRVGSIHGYLPPIPLALPETFFLRGADCWGWATWRDRWSLYRHDAAAMADEIRQRRLVDAFNLGGRVPNLRMLDDRASGRLESWAICWHASCFLADCYSLYPGRSLVRNIGLDFSGEHCVPSSALAASLTDRPVQVVAQPVSEDPEIITAFSKQYAGPSLLRRLVNRSRSMRHRLFASRADQRDAV